MPGQHDREKILKPHQRNIARIEHPNEARVCGPAPLDPGLHRLRGKQAHLLVDGKGKGLFGEAVRRLQRLRDRYGTWPIVRILPGLSDAGDGVNNRVAFYHWAVEERGRKASASR